MNKRRVTNQSKARKNDKEAKFEHMVSEYHAAKEILASMTEGSAEYENQQKICDSLFANAEKFFKQHN